MAKDPAFLFYPGDYIAGTMYMSFEEKGAYVELLMLQFNRGHMTYDMIGRMLGQKLDKIWPNIKDKFQQDESGLYYNPRLEEEQMKRKKYITSRLNNRKGKNQYSDKTGHKGGHMTSHMEDENENEDILYNRSENFKKSWIRYKKYRKDQHNFKFKSEVSEKTALKNLSNLAKDDKTQIMIIDQTIGNGWKGFFELKHKPKVKRPEHKIL